MFPHVLTRRRRTERSETQPQLSITMKGDMSYFTSQVNHTDACGRENRHRLSL